MSEDEPGPAGWYLDDEMADTQRYWDGTKWTAHVAPLGPDAPPPPADAPPRDLFESRLKIGCFGLVIVVVLGAVIGGALFGDSDGESGAKVACEDFVKDRLKSPGSADFSDVEATESGTGSWTVTGSVDSENSFGASIRNTYTCKVRNTDEDEWNLISLDLSGN